MNEPGEKSSGNFDQRNMKIEINDATLTALGNVLEHFWREEELDYKGTPEEDRPGHIFESLQKLHQFFEEATYHGPWGGDHQPSKEALIEIVEHFRTAAHRLSEAWEQLGELEVVDDILSAGYPFPNCFIETAASISAWCSMAADKLRRLP